MRILPNPKKKCRTKPKKVQKDGETINLINDKDGKDRDDIGTGKANDRVEFIAVSDDRNPSSQDSIRRLRSVEPDRNYRSNVTKNDLKNDNKGQKQGNPSQNHFSSIISYIVDSRLRTYTNDRTASNKSTGSDFSSRNNYDQRRFSYFFILA